MPNLQYSKIPLAQTVTTLFEAKGVKHIVISPGSRNAPLTLGFTHNPFFTCYSVVDERCAAFFAIGIAQQLQEPVAIVCTSGSAVLNYYPAVAEAFYSNIPLLIVSADRPREMIDIADGQTIRQEYVLQNHVVYEANLINSQDYESVDSAQNEELLNDAVNTAILKQGPVHINVPFYEPLYDLVAEASVDPDNEKPEHSDAQMDPELQTKLLQEWNEAAKKVVLIGVNQPESIPQRWIDMLLTDPSVLVLTETTSNIHHPSIINAIDQMIAPFSEEAIQNFRPDILLTFGGMIVSKKIKQLLRAHPPESHWHVDPLKAPDTYGVLTEHLKVQPKRFFEIFLIQTALRESTFQAEFLTKRGQRRLGHERYLKRIPFTDLLAFERIVQALPEYSMVQLGNSSTVRYAQLFDLDPTLTVFCNRGTSGIEGSTSTAIGAASAIDRLTTFITGDLGFLYDSNAFWNQYIPRNFKIIVLNNGGGGIFRILPGKEETDIFRKYFETVHEHNAVHICAMFGIGYHSANNEFELESALTSLYKSNEAPQLLEIFTPRTLNDTILLDYFEALR